ncbi:MAG: histidine kinase [Clostridiales bacterium]|nr:histidine kinase [Clostridiales bacterium]
MKHTRTFKATLMAYFTATMSVFCLAIAFLAVYGVRSIIHANNLEHYKESSRYISASISGVLDSATDISNYLFLNQDVKSTILQCDQDNYAYTQAVDKLDKLLMQNVMSNIYSHLNAMVVFGDTKMVYRYEQDKSAGRILDFHRIRESGEFAEACATGRPVYSTRDFYSARNGQDGKYLAVIRSIRDFRYQKIIGGQLLLFDIALLKENLLAFENDASYSVYLLDEHGETLFSMGDALPEKAAELLQPIQRRSANTFEQIDQPGRTFFVSTLHQQRCYLLFVLQSESLLPQSLDLILMVLLALVFGILASLALMRSMNKRLVRPILVLRSSIEKARQGEPLPAVSPARTGIEEMDMLIATYNQNVRAIDELAEKLSEEKTHYKDLEYRALQSKINSHFITNTLNAVRLLAIMQKADNIKQLIDAFSRLLKSTWQGLETSSTIAAELSYVQDYLFIQQVTHSYHCETHFDVAPEVRDAVCPKFLLQPLVENAYFHGVAPKEGGGSIWVRVAPLDQRTIRIRVIDNGVGMDEEKQRQVLNALEGGAHFNGIGISNIHQRLRGKYGQPYGVTIQSRVGYYTLLTVDIPRLDGQGGTDPCIPC